MTDGSAANGVESVARKFVDVALRYKWSRNQEIPPVDAEALLATIRAAGFKAKQLVPGVLEVPRKDTGGGGGKTYLANTRSQLTVLDENGIALCEATEWLDEVLSSAANYDRGIWTPGKMFDRDAVIEKVRQEIERQLAQPA